MKKGEAAVLPALEKTARLARFLSEIEAAREEKYEGAPHYQKVSSDKKLEAHESEIIGAINELLGSVAKGDPVTGGATQEKNEAASKDNGVEKALMGKVMESADKENKAAIVRAAGDVAEKRINKVIKKAGKDMAAEQRTIDKMSAGVQATETQASDPSKAKDMPEVEEEGMEVHVLPQAVIVKKDDVVAPLGSLHEEVKNTISDQLDRIGKLFKKRKHAHQHLSLADHRAVNSRLRDVAAHMMQRYADKDEERPFSLVVPMHDALKMPLKKAAWMRKQSDIDAEAHHNADYRKRHGRSPVTVGLTLPLHQARKALAPDGDHPAQPPSHEALSKPLHEARKIMAPHKAAAPHQPEAEHQQATVQKRDPVTQFVWGTLKEKGVQKVKKAKTLADLLERGVKLRKGGFLRFATPQ